MYPKICGFVPATNFQVKGQQKKPVTPYILYSSEIRRTIAEQNKTSSFGEISRIVGEKVSHQALRSKLICSFLPVPFSLSCSTAFSLFAATPPAYSSPLLTLVCGASCDQRPKSRTRNGYQIFSSEVWVRVKGEVKSGNFAEVSREIGNQVMRWRTNCYIVVSWKVHLSLICRAVFVSS